MNGERGRDGGPANRELSRRMVGLFKDYVGRGPTHSRTYVHDDLVMVVLHDTLTKAEQTLADDDRKGVVREVRHSFQATIRDRAVELIEETTGREVVAFLSDHAIDPDYAIEAFVLAGDGEGTPESETQD